MSPSEGEIMPTPFDEVDDERRSSLVQKLAKLMFKDALADPAFWAFIWLSDIEKLEKFFNTFAPSHRVLLACQYKSTIWGRVLKMFALGIAQDHASQAGLETSSETRNLQSRSATLAGNNEDETGVVPPEDQHQFRDSAIHRLAEACSRGQSYATTAAPVTPSISELANAERKYYIGSATQVEKCRTRDNMCALTKTSDSTRVAHIYPLSLQLKDTLNGHEDLWLSLNLFFSTERVERRKKAVFGQDNEALANMLCMGRVAYKLWSKCRYALKPIELSPDGKYLTVQLFWMPWWKYASLNLQHLPEAPDNTAISACGTHLDNIQTGQHIQSGNIITFTTTNLEKLPLPSMDLLDLQWVVHRLNALSGAVEATDAALGLDDDMELGSLDDVGGYDVGIWIDQPGEGEEDTDDEWEQVEVETKPLTLRLRSSST